MQTADAARLPPDAVREVANEDGSYRITPYIGSYNGVDGVDGAEPEGFLVRFEGAAIRPHFHRVEQFQVVVGGDAHVGKHHAPPVTVHYVDDSTPYGPIAPTDCGFVEFFTLRPVRRAGIWFMPGAKHEMTKRAGRNISVTLGNGASGLWLPVLQPHADGLAAFHRVLTAGEETDAWDSQRIGGNARYCVVLSGNVSCAAGHLSTRSLIFVPPSEPAPTLVAGDSGAELLLLQFPSTDPAVRT